MAGAFGGARGGRRSHIGCKALPGHRVNSNCYFPASDIPTATRDLRGSTPAPSQCHVLLRLGRAIFPQCSLLPRRLAIGDAAEVNVRGSSEDAEAST